MTNSPDHNPSIVFFPLTNDERIASLSIGDLKPYPNNSRTHSKKQVRQIADSIETFGFTNPILIDENKQILAGHGRLEAAKLLALKSVPCIEIGHLTEVEKRAYILADNKLAENAGWDFDLLAAELQFVVEAPEIDIGLTGFSIAEVDDILDLGGMDQATETDEDDRLPEETHDSAVTRSGDLWKLGDHLLLCGDARKSESYEQLLAQIDGGISPAEMVFTDPPYNVAIDQNVCGSGKIKHREFAMASGEMTPAEFVDFLKAFIENLVKVSKNGSIHYICMDWRHMGALQEAGFEYYTELKNLCVWVKDNGGMGSFYRSRHELIFVFKNGTGPHHNSFELGQNGRYRTNVWNYRGISSGTKTARSELALHPTVKPVAMVADAIKDCSTRGGIILDPFCGSGTILIAAHKTGRIARAIEIDPLYCDVSIERWQAYAKDDAILAETGEAYEAVKLRRQSEDTTRNPESPSSTPEAIAIEAESTTNSKPKEDEGNR